MTDAPVTVVSGLPRSGTSLMMQMLAAGGMPVLADDVREADDDNPRGYYEYEAAKRPGSMPAWIDDARGRVVKVTYLLLPELPPDVPCRIVLMRRDLDEVLCSQATMLERQGRTGGKLSPDQMRAAFEMQLQRITSWIAQRADVSCLEVSYNALMADPAATIAGLIVFLGGELDAAAMAACVDPALYRNRSEPTDAT